MASDDNTSMCSVTISPTEESKTDKDFADQANTNNNQNAGKMLPPNNLFGSKQGAGGLQVPSNTPKMASLAAPMPVQSSVYTANQPKNSLTPPTVSLSVASATGNPRNKVALRKGRGLMDWVRLGHTTPDLAGTGGRLLRVTPKELAKHNTKNDAWMALRGKVYNVTPYFEYHPGGEDELCRGIGKDATELFNEVHKWVNFESMLSKCLVGHLVEDSPTSCSHVLRKPQKAFLPLLNSFAKLLKTEGGSRSPSDRSKKEVTKLPPLPPGPVTSPREVQMPSYDWYQSNAAVTITVYSRWPRITHRHCTVHLRENLLDVDVIVRESCYRLRLELSKPVTEHQFKVQVGGSGCGKVSIELQKAEEGVRWLNIGRTLPGNQEFISIDTRQRVYHGCRLVRKARLTHDIVLLSVQCPPGLYLPVPAGYHTFLRTPSAPALSKPYTPVPEKLDVAAWAAETAAPGNTLHFLVKVYPDGDMSQALNSVTVSPEPNWCPDATDASVIEVTLAEGEHVEQLSRGEGEVELHKSEDEPPVTDVTLLAAGTGLTPMLSTLLDCIVLKRRVRLLFFNKTEEDIPWRDEFDVLAAENSDILKVHHILANCGSSWQGLKGRVSLELLEPLLPVGDGTRSAMMAVCGPKGFTDTTLQLLDRLGYLREEYHAFVG